MLNASDPDLSRRALALEWILLDVDGVLTDGRIFYGPEGEGIKPFDVKDGFAMRLAHHAGLKVGLLSGRGSAALERRAADLSLDAVVTRRSDKGPAFDAFLAEFGSTAERVAYVGDDLPDLPVLRRAGLSFAPADAVAEVRSAVDVVLTRDGGRGAVREMIELVLTARGEWSEVVAHFSARG